MKKMIGIGCFHFGIKKTTPFKFHGKHYLKELQECLGKISNISNIDIQTDDEFINSSFDVTENLPELDSHDEFFPNFSMYSKIEFELYLPFRVQAQLWESEEKYLDTFTEKFKILIQYSYYFPVAIVEPINPTETSDAPKALIIVKRFLEQEINEKNNYIKFETLGPSPFHLDIIIQPEKPEKDDEKWYFNPVLEYTRGYDNLFINYNESEILDSMEAFELINESIIDEFGLYYKFQQTSIEFLRRWSEIESLMESLKLYKEKNYFKRTYFGLFRRKKLIEQLTDKIIGFESDRIFNENVKNREFKDLYKLDFQLFKEAIEKDFFDDYAYPIAQLKELLNFIESRRVKNIELIIALIAAIVGGAIGAIFTIYVN